MYKILLVDDEVLIRDAVSKIIKWKELGYELIGSCKDGKEAMAFIEENPPDLVITDICMPYVNGIELSRFIYEAYPGIKVIILSGYDEFDYAKSAVKYQVMEYILKPVTAAELSAALTKLKERMDEENMRNMSIQKIRSAYASNLPLLRGRFLNSLLSGLSDPSKIAASLEEYGLSLDGPYFCVALVEGDDFSSFATQEDCGVALGEFAVFNISEELMKQHAAGEAFQNQDDQTVLIFSSSSKESLCLLYHNVLEKIAAAVSKYLSLPLTAGCGMEVHSLHNIPLSFENAKALSEYRFLLGGGQIFYSGDFAGKVPDVRINRLEWTDQIIFAIKANNREQLNLSISRFIQALREALLPKNRIIIYIQNLVLSIINVLDSTGLNAEPMIDLEKDFINSIYTKGQLSEIEELLWEFCKQVADTIYSEKEDYGKKQALLALDYINRNYSDSGISLNSVCSHLSISTSYFSTIFKNYTGETFIEALTKKRIETAKNLMETTSMKAYEVSNAVGFGDPHYFSITFKKHTGQTPTEYAKSKR